MVGFLTLTAGDMMQSVSYLIQSYSPSRRICIPSFINLVAIHCKIQAITFSIGKPIYLRLAPSSSAPLSSISMKLHMHNGLIQGHIHARYHAPIYYTLGVISDSNMPKSEKNSFLTLTPDDITSMGVIFNMQVVPTKVYLHTKFH